MLRQEQTKLWSSTCFDHQRKVRPSSYSLQDHSNPLLASVCFMIMTKGPTERARHGHMRSWNYGLPRPATERVRCRAQRTLRCLLSSTFWDGQMPSRRPANTKGKELTPSVMDNPPERKWHFRCRLRVTGARSAFATTSRHLPCLPTSKNNELECATPLLAPLSSTNRPVAYPNTLSTHSS